MTSWWCINTTYCKCLRNTGLWKCMVHFWHINLNNVAPWGKQTYPKEFMQSQCSGAEHKADQQQPQELVTKELQKGLICIKQCVNKSINRRRMHHNLFQCSLKSTIDLNFSRKREVYFHGGTYEAHLMVTNTVHMGRHSNPFIVHANLHNIPMVRDRVSICPMSRYTLRRNSWALSQRPRCTLFKPHTEEKAKSGL